MIKAVTKLVIFLTNALLVMLIVSVSATFAYADGLHRSTVIAPDGVNLSVLEGGKSDGLALMFVHGFSVSAASWRNQLTGNLAKKYRLFAFDMRDHGYSSKPIDPNQYVTSKQWADDIAAVATAKRLGKFVLIGWSYGGLPLLDYVKEHGQDNLSAMVFVGASYNLDFRSPEAGGPEPTLGPGVIENTGSMAGVPAGPPGADLDGCGAAKTCGDYGRQLAGTKRFLEMIPGSPLPSSVMDDALGASLQTPPYVRRAMIFDRVNVSGPLDHSPTLKTIKVPVLFIHGSKDQHVLPRSTEIMKELVDSTGNAAQRVIYDGNGHATFLESPKRFDADILKFVSGL